MSRLIVPRACKRGRERISRATLTGALVVLSLFLLLPPSLHAFPVNVPTYYLDRAVSLTGSTLDPRSSPSQVEASKLIPKGSSAYFYSGPLGDSQIPASRWTVTIYGQADPSQPGRGTVTVELSIFSMDGTTVVASLGASPGNIVPTSTIRLRLTITGTDVTVRNGERLGLRVSIDSQSTSWVTIFYDGQGNEVSGDESRVETSATAEQTWKQDFEANPFALSSVNRFWQPSNPSRVTQDTSHYYTGSYSLRVSDASSAGTYARYNFNTANNPSYLGLPRDTRLSFYWLSSYDSRGGRIVSIHILLVDQGQSFEHYWYWSQLNTTQPPSIYSGTVKVAGMYMGDIQSGTWTLHEGLNWKKHAELTLGTTFLNPTLVSISLQSYGVAGKLAEVYWDNLFATSYSVSPRFTSIQEGQTNMLSLRVTGAVPATNYQFEFSVTDPTGATTLSSVGYATSATETTFIVSPLYPDDFTSNGTMIGIYNVTVRQTSPVYLIAQAMGFIVDYASASSSFSVHLGDKTNVERMDDVRIQASGYMANENVNITMLGPSDAQYLVPALADSTGLVVISWTVPRDAVTGDYTVSLKGSTTKVVPDIDLLTVTRAVLRLSLVNLDKVSYQRTESLTLNARLVYPGQAMVEDGHLEFEVKQPDGLILVRSIAIPDSSGLYIASFRLPTDALLGGWLVVLPSWSSGDQYGNIGPATEETVAFTVGPAELQVESSVQIDSSQAGRTLQIQASITYPDGSIARAGWADARLEHNGVPIAEVELSFDTVANAWTGRYLIKASDPEGLWLVIISAQDLAGPVSNSIQNVFHNVLIDRSLAVMDINQFLLAGLIVSTGTSIAMAIWKFLPRRRLLSVKLETERVMDTVNKVQSTDFFRSIKDQLKTIPAKENLRG